MEFPEFCEKVREYCHVTRGSVTSWIRTPLHNAAVGGVPQSLHILGLAADVVFDQPPLPEAMRREAASVLDLHLIVEGDHDHVMPGPGTA
jgi:hypothetical protein